MNNTQEYRTIYVPAEDYFAIMNIVRLLLETRRQVRELKAKVRRWFRC